LYLERKDHRPIRTALFVPGSRPDRVDKAMRSGADMVIMDLEDAVSPTQKEEARKRVREKLLEYGGQSTMVRVNSLDSGLCEDDLRTIVVKGLDFIMLPKLETPEDLLQINDLLLEVEEQNGVSAGSLRIIGLVESALGVEKVLEIASTQTTPGRLYTIAFGAADFALDLGIKLSAKTEELAYPRAKIPIACRAGGLAPPLDTPYMIDIKDTEALVADAKRAKRLGFQGKLCVHPLQVGPCNEVFSPSQEEISEAEKIIEAFEKAQVKGEHVVQLDGKFIDPPVVERARQILVLAQMVREPKT